MTMLDRQWLKDTVELLAEEGFAVISFRASSDANRLLREVSVELLGEALQRKKAPSASACEANEA